MQAIFSRLDFTDPDLLTIPGNHLEQQNEQNHQKDQESRRLEKNSEKKFPKKKFPDKNFPKKLFQKKFSTKKSEKKFPKNICRKISEKVGPLFAAEGCSLPQELEKSLP